MKTKIKVTQTEFGCDVLLLDEPYATHQKNVWGLHQATNNATYRGVKFGRKLQRELGYMSLVSFLHPDWDAVRDAGGGEMEISDEDLAELARRSAEIDRIVSTAVPAVPASRTYFCAGHSDGCCNKVSVAGEFCKTCAHDVMLSGDTMI